MTATADTVHTAAGPATPETADGGQLQRLRLMQWTLRGALGLALAVSMAANVLHAAPDPVARSIAAWSPLALYAAIEVMTRVPIRNRLLGGIRIIATVAIAVIAGVTSYLHMVGVAERYGESWQVVYLLPISVDGLVAVLTLSLLDIASQVRTISTEPATAAQHPHPPTTAATAALRVSDGHAALQARAEALEDRDVPPASRGKVEPDKAGRRQRPAARRSADRSAPADPSPAATPASRSGPAPLPVELQPLLAPARHAYQQLQATGRPITRDTFATALRDAGQPLRSAKVTLLLTAIREPHE